MKRVLIGLSLISSMVLAEDYYGGVDFGFGKGNSEEKNLGTTINYDFKQTLFGIHGGYNLNLNSQIEFSLKSLNFDFDDGGDTDATQLGVDYIYTFNKTTTLKPYVGLGISMNSIDVTLENKDTIDGMGIQLRGGSYYTLTPKLDIGVELNYSYIGWEDLKNLADNSILTSNSNIYGLGLNLNYKF